MSVFKRRTRIVSFRLSEDEYERLRGTCVSHGIRSISDFARFATQQWVDNDSEPVLVTIRELKGKVRELDLELRELAGKVPQAGVGK
jgi:hypothetical protein